MLVLSADPSECMMLDSHAGKEGFQHVKASPRKAQSPKGDNSFPNEGVVWKSQPGNSSGIETRWMRLIREVTCMMAVITAADKKKVELTPVSSSAVQLDPIGK
jgi:hypothetical protein